MNREPNVVNMLFGSHLYSLQTENSDKDYKGIYIPTLEELLLGNYAKAYSHSTGGEHSKNTFDDVDTEVYALPFFIKNACEGETFTLDMLHCTNPISSSWIWEQLRESRTKFYSKDMKAYIGYVKKQAAKYGLKGTRLNSIKNAMQSLEPFVKAGVERLDYIKDDLFYGEYANWVKKPLKKTGELQEFYEVNTKLYQSTNTPEYVMEQLSKVWDSYGERAKQAERNEGVDTKALSHALRAGYQARDIYKDGDFEYPLKETDFILACKTGQLDYKTEIAPALESLVDEVNILADKSDLPNKVDRKYWDDWLLEVYEVELVQFGLGL